MRLLKWLFQPAYLLLIIVLVALYVNREAIFPEEVTESLEAEVLAGKVEAMVARLRSEREVSAHSMAATESVAQSADAVVSSLPAEDKGAASPQEPLAEQGVADVAAAEEATPAISPPAETGDGAADMDTAVTGDVATAPLAVVTVEAVSETSQPELLNDTAAALTEAAPVVDSATAITAASEEASQPAPLSDAAPAVVEAAAAEAALSPQSVTTLQSPEPADDLAAMDAKLVASTVSVPTEPPLAVWRAARAAVWQGELDTAVARYRELITLQPDNFDAYGEMGNVLLAQSDVAAAMEAYTSAARLIRKAGHREMAYRLASVVAAMDEEQGRALFSELSQQ